MSCTFVKTAEELEHFKTNTNWMYDCEGLYAAWATDQEALARVLPKPLTPIYPIVLSYIIEAKKPNFTVPYKEAALMTLVMKDGKPGIYTIAMMLEGSDSAVFMGRDVLSIPKKNANKIWIERNGETLSAGCSRMGVNVIDIKGNIGDFNDPLGAQLFGSRTPGEAADSMNYFYKFEIDQDEKGQSVVRDIDILSTHLQMKYNTWENASVNVVLQESDADPWAELPVLKNLGGGWTNFDLGLLGVVEKEPAPDFADALSKVIAARFDPQTYRA